MAFANSAGLGVRNHYGPRLMTEAQEGGGQQSLGGHVKVAEWVFSYDNLPTPATEGAMTTYIPQGAWIVSAKIHAVTGFVGGTGYDIGLQQNDATEIDDNGLWDALVVAELATINEWSAAEQHDGTDSGKLVNGLKLADGDVANSYVALAADGYLVVVANGTFTAGVAKLMIEYIEPDFDKSTRYTAGGTRG